MKIKSEVAHTKEQVSHVMENLTDEIIFIQRLNPSKTMKISIEVPPKMFVFLEDCHYQVDSTSGNPITANMHYGKEARKRLRKCVNFASNFGLVH